MPEINPVYDLCIENKMRHIETNLFPRVNGSFFRCG